MTEPASQNAIQVIGRAAALRVTAVGKLMLSTTGEDAMRVVAQRTDLPACTRSTITTLARPIDECNEGVARRYAPDNEEAEIDVACSRLRLHVGTGNFAAGLPVRAPIASRRMAWVEDAVEAGNRISAQLGCQAPK